MHGSAILTEKQVGEIKYHLKEGYLSQTQIAQLYGVQSPAIYKIKHGLTWAHVKPAKAANAAPRTNGAMERRC
jgi:hypothetical protein